MSLRIFMANSCWISSLQGSPGCCCWMRAVSASECHSPDACSTNGKLWKISRDNSHWNGIYIKSPNGVEHFWFGPSVGLRGRVGGGPWVELHHFLNWLLGKMKMKLQHWNSRYINGEALCAHQICLAKQPRICTLNYRAELYKKKFKDFTCAHVMLHIYMSYSDTAWLNKTLCQ